LGGNENQRQCQKKNPARFLIPFARISSHPTMIGGRESARRRKKRSRLQGIEGGQDFLPLGEGKKAKKTD